MPEGLIIQVGADVQQANKGLAQVNSNITILERQIERLQKIASMPGLNFRQQERLNGLLLSTQNELGKTKRAFDSTNPALVKFQRTTSSATTATMNFGRVIQDAPFGILGVANNINPLVESFQRLKTETGSTGKAFKALGSSLVGAGGVGLAVSVITTGLLLFGDSIFGTKDKLKSFNFELNKLSQGAKDADDKLKRLSTELEFIQQLTNINIDTNFIGDQSILKARVNVAILGEEFTNAEERATKAGEAYSKAIDIFQRDASKNAKSVFGTFPAAREIPDDLIESYSKSDQALLKLIKKGNQDLLDAQIQVEAARNKRTIGAAQIRAAVAEKERKDKKESLDKAKSDYERYVSETISRGKELAEFFKKTKVVPEFSFLDSREEQLKKALDLIKTLDQEGFGENLEPLFFKVPVTFSFDPEKFQFVMTGGEIQTLQDKMNTYISDQNLKLAPSGIQVSFKNVLSANNEAIAAYRKQLQQLASMGEFVGGKLADGFQGVFEAISGGESVIKAFGNAIKEVVSDLIQAAIRALIVRTITNLFAPGLGSIGKAGSFIGGIPGFAAGGIVSGPMLAMVGEGSGTSRSNPEIIAPLDQLRAILGDLGGGGQVIVINSRTRGRDQVLTASRERRSQRRTTGR